MILRLLAVLLLAVPAVASAATVNVELKFTPYVGDAAKAAAVTSVPGSAAIFLNGVPYANQAVPQKEMSVEKGDVDAAVWLPVEALGPAVRKGKNTVRIEFTPTDAGVAYRARLSWASLSDESGKTEKPGAAPATNMTDVGKDEKSGTGTLVLEHTVSADFVPDLPWHHYAAVTELSADDKAKLTALAMNRVDAFKPDFAEVYRLLEGDRRLDVPKIKAAKCLDAAYDAGIRLAAPKPDELEFLITKDRPEVVVRRKGRHLYAPDDASVFGKIQGAETQMCAGIALSLAFPPKLAAVKNPDGTWKVVY